MHTKYWLIALVACLLLAKGQLEAGESLDQCFRDPPTSARPWVYWFWMNGNITRTGIRADLEAMHAAGVGGALIMHVKLGDIGQHKLGQMPPDGPVRFMSDDFRKMFRYALQEADRLGMKIDMNNADGFTGSGGPWVPVDKSMKKLVWTTTRVSGGKPASLKLEQPETILDYYRDVAVIAFPRQRSLNEQMLAARSSLTASHPKFDAQAVVDNDPQTRTPCWRQGLEGQPHLLISFTEPYTADTLVVQGLRAAGGAPQATLETSQDGKEFRSVGELCLKWYPAAPTNTARFAVCTARHFRLVFQPNCQNVALSEVALGLSNKVHHWEPKAGFTRYGEWGGGSALYTERKMSTADAADSEQDPSLHSNIPAIPIDKVLNLSPKIDAEGQLNWNAPEGEWTVARIGCTSTGIKNHPASEGGHGLECDKLDASGVEAAFEGMLGKLIADNVDLAGKSFSYAHIDSWEVGIQNWTEGMASSFKTHNNYDLTPFFAVLIAGHAVGSNDQSERFLWDLRQTIRSMMAENYLGHIRSLCQKHGLKFSSEAAGRQTFLHSPVFLLSGSDLPMGEFWPHEGAPRVDGKAAASVAHLYDKPLVGAEAFTGAADFANWSAHPWRLKQIGDDAFCLGVNHFVIHYYVHQAYEGFQPGFAMGPWGIHLDRMNTWWDQASPWFNYLARCQYLLRQGKFVADVLYFPGEDAPHYLGKRDGLSVKLPSGYDFDACDRTTLLNRAKVNDGRIVLPSGMSYRYLMLASAPTMTLDLARRIGELAQAGATVIGPKPRRSPSLRAYPGSDSEIRQIVDSTWNTGRVIWDKTFEQIAKEDRLAPDFAYESASGNADVRFIHRQTTDTDLYFVANHHQEPVDIVASFRVRGKRPEIWYPETGGVVLPGVYDVNDDRVTLPLHIGPLEAFFVVFRSSASDRRVVRVTRNDQRILSAEEPAHIRNASSGKGHLHSTFTIQGWARPRTWIRLPRQSSHGFQMQSQNWLLFPSLAPETVETGNAGAGISVGTNGIIVFEHGAKRFAPVLVHPTAINNWTHIAVVYRDNVPTLFVNGSKIGASSIGPHEVVSDIFASVPANQQVFRGLRTRLEQTGTALSATSIAQLANESPCRVAGQAFGGPITLVECPNGKLQADVLMAGKYEIIDSDDNVATLTVGPLPPAEEIPGPWQLLFPSGRGAPDEIRLDKLQSWTEHADFNVKHYSGSATYRTSFTIDRNTDHQNLKWHLDLGEVRIMARVLVNGQELGQLWKPPFRLDVSAALQTGKNQLEVHVTNLWVNRLIGDEYFPDDVEWTTTRNATYLKQWPTWFLEQQPRPEPRRKAFSVVKHYQKDSPLLPSGLLGPVTLQPVRVIRIKAGGRTSADPSPRPSASPRSPR